MPHRDYVDAAALSTDIQDILDQNLTFTPEMGFRLRDIPAPTRQYYETARAAARNLGEVDKPLDIELRDDRQNHRFTQLRNAIERTAQEVTNRERFR